MSEQNTALTQKKSIPVDSRGIVINDMESMWRWSQYVSASGLAPKGMEKPESIFVATQMGLEVGLTPMAALQNIAVINGRPTIWGDAQLAIVRSTGELEQFSEVYEADGKQLARTPVTFSDDVTAVCIVKRRGFPLQEGAFSVADAKRAGLWGKAGPWSQYPARMLRFRARSFALRDNFGDALRGMLTAEEVADIDTMIDVTPKREPMPTTATAGPTFKEKRTKKTEVPAEPATSTQQSQAEDQIPGAEVKPRDHIPKNETNPGNLGTANEANREPSNSTGGGGDPAPAASETAKDPESPPADEASPIELKPEQQLVAELIIQAGKADWDTFKRGLSKQKLLTYKESWEGFHDLPVETCNKIMGAKKWALGVLDTGRQ